MYVECLCYIRELLYSTRELGSCDPAREELVCVIECVRRLSVACARDLVAIQKYYSMLYSIIIVEL